MKEREENVTKTLGTAKIEIPFRKWLSKEHARNDHDSGVSKENNHGVSIRWSQREVTLFIVSNRTQ